MTDDRNLDVRPLLAPSDTPEPSNRINRESDAGPSSNKGDREMKKLKEVEPSKLKKVESTEKVKENKEKKEAKKEEGEKKEEEGPEEKVDEVELSARRARLAELDPLVEMQTVGFNETLDQENVFAWIATGRASLLVDKLAAAKDIRDKQTPEALDLLTLLTRRGPVGELPIHLCCLFGAWDIALSIVDFAKRTDTVADIVTPGYGTDAEGKPIAIVDDYDPISRKPSPYLGENILHIAIVNKNTDIIWKLLEDDNLAMKALLKGRASGKFFSEGQPCYYGEYPLAFAACNEMYDILLFLLSKGADLLEQDSEGNNIFHLMVYYGNIGMYDKFKELVKLLQHQDEPIRHREYVKQLIGLKERMLKKETDENQNENGDEGDEEKKGGEDGNGADGPADELVIPKEDAWINTVAIPHIKNVIPRKKSTPPWWQRAREHALDIPVIRSNYLDDDLADDNTPKLYHPWEVPNYRNKTPLSLSAHYGNKAIFDHLIDLERKQLWSYGPTSCQIYMLGKLEAATDTIIQGSHLNLLTSVTISHLITKKWERFAKLRFFVRFGIMLALLGFLTAAIILRTTPDGSESRYVGMAVCWGFVLAVAFYKFAIEVRQLWEDPVEYFIANGAQGVENILSLSSTILVFLTTILHLINVVHEKGDSMTSVAEAEAIILSLACITIWSYMFFFLLGFYLTGPLLIMIRRMMLKDALRWIIVFVVFLFGFNSARYALHDTEGDASGGSGWTTSMNIGFQILTGGFDPDDPDSLYPEMSRAIGIVYVLLISILLLNILIAMMAKSFDDVWGSADIQWHLERARITAGIQEEQLGKIKNKYWIEIAAADDEIDCWECNPDREATSANRNLKYILRVDADWNKNGGAKKFVKKKED